MSTNVEEFWVSSRWATGQVDVKRGCIIATPPVWYKFIGQPFTNLIRWLGNPEVKPLPPHRTVDTNE